MRLKSKLATLCVFSTGLVWFPWSSTASAAGQHFSADIGVAYETGDYGTGETTDTWSIPLTFRYFPFEKLDFELYVPIYRTSNTNTTIVGGMHGSRRNSRQNVETTNSEFGLGDTSLTAGYTLIPESEHMFSVRPLLYAKFPTGDEDNGLGTGEFDFGGGLSVSKWLGNLQTYAELLYITTGESDTLNLEDYWSYNLSMGYALNNYLRPEVSLVGSTNPFAGADDIQALEIAINYLSTNTIQMQGYISFGLTEASSDFGSGVSVTFNF